MPNDNIKAKGPHRGNNNTARPSRADEKNDQRSRETAQQDSVDIQEGEEDQPEIPKVGSRDAPGG
jgi:hypothetical protein